MSSSSLESAMNVSLAQRIDAVCNRFESAWQRGERPDIESQLTDWPNEDRVALWRELVQLDVYYRRQAGEVPHADDYPKFPLRWSRARDVQPNRRKLRLKYRIFSVAFGPDGKRLAACDENKTVLNWWLGPER